MNDLTVLNVRPWGGPLADIAIREGVIRSVRPVDAQSDRSGYDGEGRIALPAFSDAHVHLDSTRIGLPFRPHSAEPGPLWNMIANDRAHWRTAEATVSERAAETLGRAIAYGMTRARSYAQIDADCRLERFEGVVAAREFHRERASVEIVAFPQAGLLREPGVVDLIEEALGAGADVVGGIDPNALDKDPRRHLDIVFELAERHDVRIDIHLHEPGELGLATIHAITERARALDHRGRITIAHAFCLADITEAARGAALDDLADLDIALTTIAPGGRPGLPLRGILDRGIRLGLGQDGQRDYWSPYGNADMLDRTWILSYTNNLRRDALIEEALQVATLGGARVIDAGIEFGETRGFDPGDPADFVLLPGETPTSVVMDRPDARTVVHSGRIVAEQGVLR